MLKHNIGKYEFVENEDYKFCSPKWGSKGRGGENRENFF